MKKVIYYSLILIFAAVFLFSAWNLGTYFWAARENQSQYDDLAQRVEDAKTENQPTVYFTVPQQTMPHDATLPNGETLPPVTEPDPPTILPEYAQLYLDNPDLVGWIKIEGTQLNYPVMQTPEEPDHYLDHNFYGEYSARGCIYVEEECDVFAPSDNVTIYGHHMRDGSMFTVLTRYSSRSYLEEHPYIIFNTLLERRTYQVIAVFTTTASVGEGFRYNAFINARSEEEFNDYIATCKDLSLYSIDATAEYGDKLITLSTCEYTQTNGRFVVVAKLIETE